MDGEQAALAVGILWVGAAEAARAARLREVCRERKRSSLRPGEKKEDQEGPKKAIARPEDRMVLVLAMVCGLHHCEPRG